MQEIRRRGDRHVLADVCGMRQCGDRGRLSQVGIGLLGVALAFGLSVSRWPMPSVISRAVISIRRSRSDWPPVDDFRQPDRALRIAQVWRDRRAALLYVIASGAPGFDVTRVSPRMAMASTRPALQHHGLLHHRGGDDDDVPVRHHGVDPWQGAGGFCAARHRTWRW